MCKKVLFLILIMISFWLLPGFILAFPIPDTGQSKCYNDSTEIPCPQEGEPFYGQDATYTINPPSYTKLDASGNDLPDDAAEWVMVRDNITGLIWEMKQNMDFMPDFSNPHDADNAYTWYDSNPETNGGDAGTPGEGTDTEDFINALNTANYGGYSDWRMPTIRELRSIVDYGRNNPTINTFYFPVTAVSVYWSSTTDGHHPCFAYCIGLDVGFDDYNSKDGGYNVRAVRGEQYRSLNNFIINGDGTVTDTSTGLMWQQDTAPGTYTWPQALSSCDSIFLAGYSDWRLPTVNELDSIVDRSQYETAIHSEYFPNTAEHYWSSNTDAYYTAGAWSMHFSLWRSQGKSFADPPFYVRAVRGGQNLLFDHLAISAPRQADIWEPGEIKSIIWDTKGITGNVKLSLSRQGGKDGTFEYISESTENDGYYSWVVTGPVSANCVIKIEPISDSDKSNAMGLFSIDEPIVYIKPTQVSPLQKYRLSMILHYRLAGPMEEKTTWNLSDNTMANLNGDVLTAAQNGCVTVSTTCKGKQYSKIVYLKTEFDQFEMEQNNSPATATPLSACRFMEGEILLNDMDYFRITIPSDAITEVGYFSRSTTADVKVEIFDSSQALLASAVSTNGKSLLFPLGLTAGTYYVKLTPSGEIDQDQTYDVVYKAIESLPQTGIINIPIGGSGQGRVKHLQDKASFAFNTAGFEKRQGFYVEFLPDTITADYHIAVKDGSGNIIGETDSSSGLPARIDDAIPGSGSYIIEVTAGQVIDAESTLTIQVGQADYAMEVEPNDTYQESSPFEVNEPIKGFLAQEADIDYVSFPVSAPSYLELSFEFPEGDQDVEISIYKDSDQNLINGITAPAGQKIVLPMGVSIGTYYIKIDGNGATADKAHPYTLTIEPSDQTDLEIESNNTLKFANAIEKDMARKGRIFSASDMDYFGFHLPETAIFSFTFDPDTVTGDYKVSLVDENDQTVSMKTSTDGTACTINSSKTPGNYYIKIENNGDVDQHSTYSITLTSAAAVTGLKQLVGVTVSGTNPEMSIGGSQTLTATASYSDATSEVIASPLWSSLDEGVATVNAAGLVNATGQGTTSIVAAYGGLVGKFDIAVGAPTNIVSQHYGNLILVAGGGADAANTLKESTQYLSDLVYSRFQHRLFTNEDIFYFNPVSWHDIDGDGYDNNVVDDDSLTVAEFGASITTWAAGQCTDGPLYIYLIDHGGIDTFKVFPNEIITAEQLRGCINTFQNATGRRVIVMIEACKSGSFTDDLGTTGDDVIVVTSTDNKDSYIQMAGRISFTQFFIDKLLTGDSLYKAWFNAKDNLKRMGLPYSLMNPQLAEGIFSASRNTILGGDFVIAGIFPEISGQSPNATIQANTALNLYVNLTDLEGIDSVWTVALTPDYVPPSTSQDLEAPEVALPVVNLVDPERDGRYEGSFSNFIYNGEYRFTFYARNVNGNVTASPLTVITVSGGQDPHPFDPGDVDGDGDVDLADAVSALKVLAGHTPTGRLYKGADVNGDEEIGLAEVVYILQRTAGLRSP